MFASFDHNLYIIDLSELISDTPPRLFLPYRKDLYCSDYTVELPVIPVYPF